MDFAKFCFYVNSSRQQSTIHIEQFKNFLNKEQRDPRLNELIYPRYTIDDVEKILEKFGSKIFLRCSIFQKYLQGEENSITPQFKNGSSITDFPLTDYFINSAKIFELSGE